MRIARLLLNFGENCLNFVLWNLSSAVHTPVGLCSRWLRKWSCIEKFRYNRERIQHRGSVISAVEIFSVSAKITNNKNKTNTKHKVKFLIALLTNSLIIWLTSRLLNQESNLPECNFLVKQFRIRNQAHVYKLFKFNSFRNSCQMGKLEGGISL